MDPKKIEELLGANIEGARALRDKFAPGGRIPLADRESFIGVVGRLTGTTGTAAVSAASVVRRLLGVVQERPKRSRAFIVPLDLGGGGTASTASVDSLDWSVLDAPPAPPAKGGKGK